MSTTYIPSKRFNLKKLKKIKEVEVINNDCGDMFFCNENYMHYSSDKKGNVIDVTRFGGNNAVEILNPIEKHLGIRFVSEHELEFNEKREEFVCHCCMKPI